jgi:murein L,D-transpeptidase YafK
MCSRISILFVLVIALSSILSAQDFKESQLKNGRVSKAYEEKGGLIKALIQTNRLDTAGFNIFLRAFKEEQILEIWATDSLHEHYVLMKEYRICRISGDEGPKRRQGDRQIPEGCYHIDRFNPWSSFHLSLGINYPNASDRLLSDRKHPGGEIFIHGSCVTIGCIPMTDDRIKEIYILAVEAKNNGQERIPLHVFPCKMSGEGYQDLKEQHAEDESLIDFWNNLEEAYLYFEMNKTLPVFVVDANGRYCLH